MYYPETNAVEDTAETVKRVTDHRRIQIERRVGRRHGRWYGGVDGHEILIPYGYSLYVLENDIDCQESSMRSGDETAALLIVVRALCAQLSILAFACFH